MKRFKNLFDEIIDFENLHKAYLSAAKGKRYRSEVLKYSTNLEENLIILQNELIYKTYEVGRYRKFFVYEPKKRLIMALPFKDRVVQWAIYRMLYPLLDKQFIYHSYACRIDKGTHAAIETLERWLKQADRKPETYYYLKLDIEKFFYRIDQSILISILKRKIQDDDLIELLEKIIKSETTNFGIPTGIDPTALDIYDDCNLVCDIGIPIGNLTSQIFANLYLNELDQYCKHELKVKRYIRYMDDVIILSPNKEDLHYYRDSIETFLDEKLRLRLNNKTAIRKCSQGIEFVGFRMFATHKKLRKKTVKRIKARLAHITRQRLEGKITEETYRNCIASYAGILKHCKSYKIRQELNRIYQRELRKHKQKEAKN